VEGAIRVSPDRVSQDLKENFGGFKSRTRETTRFSGSPSGKGETSGKIVVGVDLPIGR
jgi:hypothetical protein